MNVVYSRYLRRFPIPFQYLQHHLKLKPWRVPLPFATHCYHLSPPEAILPHFSIIS